MDPLHLMSLYGPVAFHYYHSKNSYRILLLSDLHYKDQHCKDDYHVVDWLHDLFDYQPLDLYLESDYWLDPTIHTNYLNRSPLVDLLNSDLPFHCIDLRSIKYLQKNTPVSLVSFNHSDRLVERLVSMSNSGESINSSKVFELNDLSLRDCVEYLMCVIKDHTHYHRLYRQLYLYALNEDVPDDYLHKYMKYYRQIVVPQWRRLEYPYQFDESFRTLMMKRIDKIVLNVSLKSFDVYLLVQEIGNIPIHYYGLIMMLTSPMKNLVCYAGQNHINFYREFFAMTEIGNPLISIENTSNLDDMKADQCLLFPTPFNYFS